MITWYLLSSVFVSGFTGTTAIVSVTENSVELDRESAVSDMAAGSFYHDLTNQRIYLWPTESDNPNTNGKTYMFYVWLGFATDGVTFAIQGEADYQYPPVLNIDSVPPYTMQINELFSNNVTAQFGAVKIHYPEWTYQYKDSYVWINAIAIVKYAENAAAAYGSYDTIVTGLIQKIDWGDQGVTLQIQDVRDRLFSTIPPDRFLLEDFPYLDGNIHFNTRPVLVGEKLGIHPNRVNTITFTYEITQTSFDFHNFSMESIDAVYLDGVALSTPADYTTDLANGQFSLTADPGDGVITCDACGLQIARDFSLSAWDDTYTENIADITFFYLRLQGIAGAYLDESTFETLQTAKTGVQCGDWLFEEIEFAEKIKELQITGQFHLLPSSDGRLKIVRYSRSEAPTIIMRDYDYSNFVISRDSNLILNRVLVRYDRNPEREAAETEGGESLGQYTYYRRIEDPTAHKYQVVKMKNYKSIINNPGDAENLSNDLISLFERPIETINFQTGHEAISCGLLDKLSITKTALIGGAQYTIYDEEPFVITKMTINWSGFIQIEARKDPATVLGQNIQDHDFIDLEDHAFNNITT